MTHYTAVKIDFTLASHTPKRLLNFLKYFFSELALPAPEERDAYEALTKHFGAQRPMDWPDSVGIDTHFLGDSKYHPGWQQRRMTLLPTGEQRFCSYASTKRPHLEVVRQLLMQMLAHLTNAHGSIVVKFLYSNTPHAEVLWLDRPGNRPAAFVQELGYRYRMDHGAVIDPAHPNQTQRDQAFDTLDPTPDTIAQTRAQRTLYLAKTPVNQWV